LTFDVIIIGCGPAGIFSALELSKNTDLRILMLDRGPSIGKRKCPASRGMECVAIILAVKAIVGITKTK